MKKPERKDLIKIADYIWEIPKSFREDMRVPARIFAEEKMLDDILEDKSLWQLTNVASLPGIYKYALGMPDIHEGYGMPVGGVAAFDYDEGIISPGICGYDINCLHPETKVNLDFGTYLEIKDLKPGFKVHFFDKENKKINSAKILFVLKRKEKEIYKIGTKLGNEILITEDHPIYTLDGMKEVKNLILGEKILIYPFKGVKYEKQKRKLILNEKKFIEFCIKNGFNNSGNKLKQILSYLKKRNLLPLYTDSSCLPYLLKIFGYALGDGAINNNFSYLYIWGKKENLEEIKRDLEILGINPLISNRKRKYRLINNYGKEYTFERTEYELKASKSFALLLCALGYPFGRKTEKEFLLPKWFKDLVLWQKRLFLAGFLGAELSTPKTFKEHKFNFYSLTLNINKNLKLLKNGLKFMNEIRKLLKEFGVETTEIKIIKELSIKGKTIGLRFQIKSNIKNLTKFFERVGFEYNKEKQELNNLALAYLKYKFKIIKQREEIRKKAKILYKLGIPFKKLEKIFVGPFINTRFLEISIWENTFNVRVAFNFYSFEEFIKNFNYKNGFLIDEIEKIEKLNYKGYVYDLTINHKDHNFIANNFIVSNCGVRLAVTDLDYEEVKDKIPKLTEEIFKQVPSGVGRGGFWKLNNDEMKKVLENGAQYIVELGYGEKEDLEATESFGKLEGADAEVISKTAKDRGRDQLGTMGAGNHFVEVQRVQEVFDEEIAKKLVLEKGKITILIHCGSRGLGHQVATDYIRQALNYIDKQNIELPDRELAYFLYLHPEGQNYLSAMKASANFAFANRQLILHQVRKAFKKVFGKEIKLKQVYDVAHNIVKIEEYEGKKLIVHRKGVTRAFWKGHPELAPKYQEIGQPTLIPGSMGTSSYILIGQELAKGISFGSAPHGAGRLMSRAEAKRKVKGSELKKELEKRGIAVAAGSMSGLAEEAPIAYKDVSEVVEVVHNIGIAKKLAKLVPVGVIKG
jgi:tRNA-splicing ligase RtcB